MTNVANYFLCVFKLSTGDMCVIVAAKKPSDFSEEFGFHLQSTSLVRFSSCYCNCELFQCVDVASIRF